MAEILNLITENAELIAGLAIAGLLLGFRILAKKSKNTVDDKIVDFAEKNKAHAVKFIEEQLKKMSAKVEAEKAKIEEEKAQPTDDTETK